MATLLEARQISKQYAHSVFALRPSDFVVARGAIHGLVGKNGAGKSTLVGLVAGSVKPTTGSVHLDGVDITGDSVGERRRRGIFLLRQHTELVPDLSVAENLLFPQYPVRRGMIDWAQVRRVAAEHLRRYDVDIPVDATARSRTLAEQRKLAIVRTLVDKARLVLLDEPTTALDRRERMSLFAWIRRLNFEGTTFVYISHVTSEIRELCTDYTVLRDGAVVAGGAAPRELRPTELAGQVTGADVRTFVRERRPAAAPHLRLQAFETRGVSATHLELAAGEVVGLVGLPGSGARELARALGGLRPITGGTVELAGTPVRIRDVRTARRQGIGYLPGDRISEGMIPQLSSRENVVVGRWPTRRSGLLDVDVARQAFRTFRERLAIRTHDDRRPVSELSGGNQQKVLLGRVLRLDPQVLILDEPTLGIDVEAKEEVHRAVDAASRDGAAVLLLAYDPEELVRLVDRALVFRDGELVARVQGSALTIEQLTALESGTAEQTAAEAP